MFDAWSPWTWVAVAWLELVLAYLGYLLYLNWRSQRIREEGAAEDREEER